MNTNDHRTSSDNIADLQKLIESQPAAGRLTLMGMVRPGTSKGTIGFAIGTCDTWVELPTNLVVAWTQLSDRTCKDHRHRAFKIELARPAGDVFFDLLVAVLERAKSSPQPNNSATPTPHMRLIGMTCFECWIRGGEPEECYPFCR